MLDEILEFLSFVLGIEDKIKENLIDVAPGANTLETMVDFGYNYLAEIYLGHPTIYAMALLFAIIYIWVNDMLNGGGDKLFGVYEVYIEEHPRAMNYMPQFISNKMTVSSEAVVTAIFTTVFKTLIFLGVAQIMSLIAIAFLFDKTTVIAMFVGLINNPFVGIGTIISTMTIFGTVMTIQIMATLASLYLLPFVEAFKIQKNPIAVVLERLIWGNLVIPPLVSFFLWCAVILKATTTLYFIGVAFSFFAAITLPLVWIACVLSGTYALLIDLIILILAVLGVKSGPITGSLKQMSSQGVKQATTQAIKNRAVRYGKKMADKRMRPSQMDENPDEGHI